MMFQNAALRCHISIVQLGITYYALAKSNQPHRLLPLQRGVSSTPSSCFDDFSLTNLLTLANNSHFPGTNSLSSTSQLLPNLSNVTSAKRGLHQLYHIEPQFFVAGGSIAIFVLPGSSNKIRPTGHRRGRPPLLVTETFLPA